MANVYTGTEANNEWTVVNPGTFTLDGLGGVDTLFLGTSLRSAYTITRAADGAVQVDSVSGASGQLHATLYNIEKLVFNNKRDTLDLATYFGDTTAPTLVGTSPADEATGVAVGANIVLSFSEAVVRGSGSITLRNSAGEEVASFDAATSAALSFAGSTLTLNPPEDLAPGTSYVVSVAPGAVKDTSGNAYTPLNTYNFSTAAKTALTGTDGNDSFTPVSAVRSVDGAAGLDTVVLPSASSAYVLTATASGFNLVARDGSQSLALSQVERLQFADHKLALDLAGKAGEVAKTLGATFGAASVQDLAYVGIGLQLADGGLTYAALMQLALETRLGANASSSAVVNLLWTHVVGTAPTAAEAAPFVALLDSGAVTPADLGMMAADLPLNTTAIGLVGLVANGLPYVGGGM